MAKNKEVDIPVLPPMNMEAERGVISSVLINPDAMDECGSLRAEHFYHYRHQVIWESLIVLCGTIRPDVITLADHLNQIGKLEEIGGFEFLGTIYNEFPNSSHARYYANLVISKWRSRQAKCGASELVKMIDSGAGDDDVADMANKVLSDVIERNTVAADVGISDVMIDAFNSISARLAKGESAGIPTGFSDLDKMIVGIQPTELVIVAARPAVGKSAFAGCLMLQLARRGIGTLFISLEMSKLEISERLLCVESLVSGTKLKDGSGFDEFELDSLMQAAGRLGELPIRIDDQPNQKFRQIASTARRCKRKHNIGFVIVDYLQLISPERDRDVREQEVAQITKSLKGLAKELSIPVIVLAQLNRAVENREDKKPRLADLRESGAIEQDADKVLFLHRPSVYDPEDRPGECDVIVAKNRCGKTGMVALAWLAESTQFRDLARHGDDLADRAAAAFPMKTTRDWTR